MNFTTLLQHPCVLLVARLVLAIVFLVAAASKLRGLHHFARIVVAYQVLPPELGYVFAYVLPWMEAILGFCLLLGVGIAWAAAVVGVLLSSFAAAGAVNLLRGRRDLQCGCFGERRTISAVTIVRDMLLLLLALQVTLFDTPRIATGGCEAFCRTLQWHPRPVDLIALAVVGSGLWCVWEFARRLRHRGRPRW